MYTGKIKHIHIHGLWGVKDIETSFAPNVNIFIGQNGTNKTVFLNLLDAALTADVKTLASIDFSQIEIFIDAEVGHIRIEKESKDSQTVIRYDFQGDVQHSVYRIDMDSYRLRRIGRSVNSDIYMLRSELKSLVNISWLSVNRDNVDLQYLDSREIVERLKNMVDIKIEELVKSLGMYQLQLESEANAISNDFKKEVMSMMLYDEKEDYYSGELLQRFRLVDTKELKIQLYKAFSTLGIAKDSKEAIDLHVQKIGNVIDKIANLNLDLNDAFVLALVRRTFSIIEISQKHEEQTKILFAPINNFWKCLKRFMPSKKFEYDKEKGELSVTLQEDSLKKVPISLSALSSGEKQLFILLTEALLQRERNYLFIADEPELSLHIKWQKMILPEMLKINPNAQVIVATHSPEVAGHYPDKIINMANISSYNE